MSAIRKRGHERSASAAIPAPREAFDYDEPLDPELIRRLSERAKSDLAMHQWTLIDGFDWDGLRELDEASA